MPGLGAPNAVLSNPDSLREIADGLYSVLPDEAGAASYDRRAAGYEAVVRWPGYHRIAWGSALEGYTQFGRTALEAAGADHFSEVGCGSLLFTSSIYTDVRAASVVLVDRSLQMLRRALTRLDPASARNVIVLHADAAGLPVRDHVFSTVLCLSLLHVPCERRAIVEEFRRTLIPGRGRLFLSALVKTGRWSDAYLKLLHRAGEMGPPMTADELSEIVTSDWGQVERRTIDGNMCYLTVRHRS